MKKYMITIPEPCHVGWNNMQPGEKGRYCSSCEKTVIDFTRMNDQEIMAYLKQHKNICGHFRKSQVDRVLTGAISAPSRKIHWPAVAAMLIAGMFQCTPATLSGAPNTFTANQEQVMHIAPEKKQEETSSRDSIVTIKVTVKDMYSGAVLTGAKLEVKGVGVFNVDKNGMLVMSMEVIKIPGKLEILLTAEGYMDENITLQKTKVLEEKAFIFYMENKNSMIDGGIRAVEVD